MPAQIRLEDDVASEVRRLAGERAISGQQMVNELLRAVLDVPAPDVVREAATPPAPRVRAQVLR